MRRYQVTGILIINNQLSPTASPGVYSLYASVETFVSNTSNYAGTLPAPQGLLSRRRASCETGNRSSGCGCSRKTSTSRCHSGGSCGRGLTLKQDPRGGIGDCKEALSLDDIRCCGGVGSPLSSFLYIQQRAAKTKKKQPP